MYNKRKFNKVNDKKVLHKVKKQWVVLSLSMLAMIGAGGAIATQTHASTMNAPQVQQEKQVSSQQTPNANKQSTPAKPVIKLHTQAQNTPVSTIYNSNKGKQLSLSDDASSTVHQTPSIDDIVSAVDSDIWNSQYGSKYTDLLSNLNYNNVQVFDNPTAYSNYLYGNSNVPKTNQYQNALTNVKQDLNGFAAYSRVQSLQNLINTTTTNPSTYSPIFSNPLFNGFEITFNDNDANTYNGILNNFKSLETDRNNNADQASDLRNALNGLNSLSNSAKEAVTKFYGISLSDISNEIDRLNSGYTPQEMVYQPIELKYYDVASKPDYNASNENVAASRTPVKAVILNESDFGNANPYTLISNPNFNFNEKYSNSNYYNAPFIANSNLQVPNGYSWTGLNSSDVNGSTINGLYIPGLNSDEDKDSYIKSHPNLSMPTYYDPTQQQLHFHLIPQSEVNQPEVINAYVRHVDNADVMTPTNIAHQQYSMKYLHDHDNTTYTASDGNSYYGLCKGVYGIYNGTTLYIGGDFSNYCDMGSSMFKFLSQSESTYKYIDNNDSSKVENDVENLIRSIPNKLILNPDIRQNVTNIVLEDSTGLDYGNCSYMFANLPNLQNVIRVGNFDSTYGKDGISNISWMFANDPHLMSVQDNTSLPWDFNDNDKAGVVPNDWANYTFDNDKLLNDISGLSNWDMSGFTEMNGMFYNDESLNNLSPISKWDVGNVHQMDDMFNNNINITPSSLQDLAPWNLRGLETAVRLFANDYQIDNIPTSWMHKPIDTGSYPDVVDAFKGTKLSFNNYPGTSKPEWILLGNSIDSPWLPKMYRTENGHYSFTPDPNAIYLGDPYLGFNGVYYKDSGYLILTNVDYSIDKGPSDSVGNVQTLDWHEKNGTASDSALALPPRQKLLNDLQSNGIFTSDIKKINIIASNEYTVAIPTSSDNSLYEYFANLPELQSIQCYQGLVDPWPSDKPNVKGLFANDPKLDSVIGFFGNEQALEDSHDKDSYTGDPHTGNQSMGLIHKLTFDGNTPVITHNLFENATSTACMFDGDRSLFNDSNAKANIDAISSIPMYNITDASYMFRNTGLNDSNIVTNWDLSKLQHADDMFAGCNLTNLNGFSKLGDWTNKHYYVPYRRNPAGDGEPTADANGVQDGCSDNSSDKVTKIVPNKLQSASYMFADNPHLTDLSGISGNNIDINPITNVSHMFDGDTDLTDVSSIENGNNNWRFNQQPNVSNMFSNTNVGYDTPKVENNYGQFILGAMPKQDNDHIDFNGDSSKNTIVHGDDGTNSRVNAPEGYHFINGSNGQFTFGRGTHTFNVAPDTMVVPVEFQDTTNGSFLDLNPNANGSFTVNKRGTISFNNDVLSELQNEGYQLSQNNNYSFTVTPTEVRSNGTLYPGYEPTFNVDPIPATSTVEYEYNGHDVTDNGSTKRVTGDKSVDNTTFNLSGLVLPMGYQLSANNPTTDAYSNNHVVVNVTPIQATDNIVYKNGYQVVSGDNHSTNSVTGNEFITPNSFNTNNLVLPNGYELAGNGTDNTYNGNIVEVQVVPKPTTTTVHYVYNGQPLATTTTKPGVYNGSFDTDSLSLPNGYNLADGNQTISDNNADVAVNLVPQRKTDTINFVDSQGIVSTAYASGNSSATGLPSSHFTVGNTPNDLPSGYQVENPNQVINYDGTIHTIMIKPLIQPSHKSGNKPNNNTSSVNPTPSHKSGNKPNNMPSVKPTPSHKSGNKPNNNTPSVNPTPNHKSGNKSNNTPSVNPTPSHKSGNKPNTPSHKSGNKPSGTSSASSNSSKGNSSTNSSASNSNINPSSASSNNSTNTGSSTSSANTPKSNSSSTSNSASSTNSGTASSANSSSSANVPESSTTNSTASSSSATNSSSNTSTNASSTNIPNVNPTPSFVPTPNPSDNIPNVNPQPSPQPAVPTNSSTPISPVMPSTNTSSSANNAPTASTTNYVSPGVNSEPMNSAPVTENSNFGTPSEKKATTKYVKVAKAIFLHTSRNFTKRNTVLVVKPGIIFKIEKSVKAHSGARRYEIKYNKKNYFITANKRLVDVYYKTTKHANNSVNNYIHYRYAKVVKTLQLHTSARFTKRNGIKVVRPGAEFRIDRIVKNHGLVRYEVRYQGHNYFITANRNYIVNAYLQKYNFRKHGYRAVRVIKSLNEYRKLSLTKRGLIRHFNRGSVLPVKRVITLNRGKVTRLRLTNGRYVTANKDFVKVIK